MLVSPTDSFCRQLQLSCRVSAIARRLRSVPFCWLSALQFSRLQIFMLLVLLTTWYAPEKMPTGPGTYCLENKDSVRSAAAPARHCRPSINRARSTSVWEQDNAAA